MKKILAMCLLCFLAPSLWATTLVNDAGPHYASSFDYNWITLAGWTCNAQSSANNTVTYDASTVNVGSPPYAYYMMKITVYDLTSGILYSSTSAPITSGSNVLVLVPAGHAYNVTFWVQSGQPDSYFSSGNYVEVKLANINISN